MKYCNVCNTQYINDDLHYCMNCGNILVMVSQQTKEELDRQLTTPYPPQPETSIQFPPLKTTVDGSPQLRAYPPQPLELKDHLKKESQGRIRVSCSIGIIILVIGIAISFSSIYFAWYVYEYDLVDTSDSSTADLEITEFLEYGEYELVATSGDGNTTVRELERESWEDQDKGIDEDGNEDPEHDIVTLYSDTLEYLIISIILGCLALVLLFLHGSFLSKKSSIKYIGGCLSIIAGVIILISVITVMQELPSAHEKATRYNEEEELTHGPGDSFWSSESSKIITGDGELHYDSKWYPSTGWFMAIGGSILLIAGGPIYLYGSKKSKPENDNSLEKDNTPVN